MKELELYDIYGTWHVPFWQTKLFLNILLAIGIIIGMLVVWLLYKKYKTKKIIPLSQQLLAQLAAVRTSLITSTEDAQRAYALMTDALKAYFEHYYDKPFKTLSDSELPPLLASCQFPQEYTNELKRLLEDGTQVKFARENALQQQVNQHVELAITIINHLEKVHTPS